MSDALLSVAVGATMTGVSAGFIGKSINKINKIELEENKIPMMGVMGAFVFAAQMINFTIPGTGSSGHIGGGVLLAALLGPYPSLITMASILLIQCLFFGDGGLLALGSNIFNIGVITCLVAFPMVFRPMVQKKMTIKRITVASVIAVTLGLQLGSLAVVLETTASGITELPFLTFLSFMQPIHLAIGLVEGGITAAVLIFIYQIRPEILANVIEERQVRKGALRKMLLVVMVAALLTGGVFSIYASSNPDGLEWSIAKVMENTQNTQSQSTQSENTQSQNTQSQSTPSEIKQSSQNQQNSENTQNSSNLHNTLNQLQEKTAIMPDYTLVNEQIPENVSTTGIAGILGGLVTLLIVIIFGAVLLIYKRKIGYRNHAKIK
jgi:cobalt/nickel transport system permease protein